MENSKLERIAKVIARAGICSRRNAEVLIAEGKVRINGELVETPATLVSAQDKIEVNGKPLPKAEKTRMWIFYKPTGFITSNKDEQGRRTIFDILPQDMPRVVTVGRLDLNSEGLLLLTNDGELARKLELPENGWKRSYRVRVIGTVDESKLANLKNGITIKDIRYGSIEAQLEKQPTGKNSWLLFTLSEGKNREIRKVCEYLGLTVNRLIRISYGPFKMEKMAAGKVIEIDDKIIAKL